MPDHLTCLLRNLYAGQEATVELDMEQSWLKIGKRVCQGCILSPCLFNLYAEHMMQNARLDESQARIKISRKNIHHLIKRDGITPMAKSEEELRSLLMRVKEESEKTGLKRNTESHLFMAGK